MQRSLFIAATGMNAQKLNMDVISNNLANVTTNGFKKGRADFEDLMYQTTTTAGAASAEGVLYPTGVQIGLGVKPVSVSKTFTEGDLKNTGNPLDLAIEGQGFFRINMPDGTTAYSRSGTFRTDNEGRIVTPEGYVLQPEMTVPNNALSITVSADGIVSVMQAGQTAATQIGQLELAKFINPQGLSAIGKNLFLPTDASGDAITANPTVDGMGSIQQGFIETSNVSVVEEMVNMIIAQRAYEVNSKAVQTSDDMLQIADNLKR